MFRGLKEKGSPLLVVELGDVIEADSLKGSVVNPFILDQMEDEGTAAMIPGILELTYWDRFERLMAGRPIAVISSNVRRAAGDALVPIAPRSQVVTVGDVKVGLLGVIGAEEFRDVVPPPGQRYEVQDPGAAIAELVPKLAGECDLVVVLACMDDRSAAALASKLQGVDVLLGGHMSISSDHPLKFGDVIVNRSGLRGQVFSTTRLILSPENKILDWFGHNTVLDRKWAGDPAMERLVAQVEARARLVQRGDRASVPSPAAPPRAESAPMDRARFLGAHACHGCHGSAHDQWAATAHATAWQALVREEKINDPECLACHTTGHGRPAGYGGPRASGDLRGVQCEACHGPGSGHERGGNGGRVAEQVCRVCHTAQWSPNWDFSRAYELVRH